MKRLPPLMLLLAITFISQAQKFDLVSLFNKKKLTLVNRSVEIIKEGSLTAIRLNNDRDEGIAWLKGVSFSTGTIEVDLRGEDIYQRSFVGVAFHGVNDSTYEGIYFRPFNFMTTDSIRRIHAVQYIAQPEYTWRKLRETRNGEFEKGLVHPPDPTVWLHARIVVTKTQVSVFVNNDTVASLVVPRLKSVDSGNVGVWVADASGGDFSTLSIRAD